MITEDYCSFELSRLLKEKGFNVELQCYSYDAVTKENVNIYWQKNINGLLPRCTHQLAMKWLRENNIIITPQPEYFSCDRCESWGIDIWAFSNYEKLPVDFPTYEDAVEAALKYCLIELI